MPTEKLPVIVTAVEAIKLPLIHWPEFARFASVPAALIAGIQLTIMTWIWRGNGQTHILAALLVELFLPALMTPLVVAWTILVIKGLGSVASRSLFRFSRAEWRYLITQSLLEIGTISLVIISLFMASPVYFYGSRTVLAGIMLLLSLALFVGGILSLVRLSFALVEMALATYVDIRRPWRLSKGLTFRLCGILVLTSLPYSFMEGIVKGLNTRTPSLVLTILLAVITVILGCLTSVAVIGGLALAYKFAVAETENTAVAMS